MGHILCLRIIFTRVYPCHLDVESEIVACWSKFQLLSMLLVPTTS